jgi:NADH-quinone oxidoreductase subunit N
MMGSLDYSVISTQIGHSPLAVLAFIFILSGFAFKISAVPFHLWTADVYQGAPVAVTAFLSVVSKSAVIMVMIPFLYQTFEEKIDVWYPALIMLALASVLVANLFAIQQLNIKRLLAFSSAILLMGISFLYGMMGSLDYSVISTQIGHSPLAVLAFLFILSGFAFKISAVPFHLWTADVYQGAPVAVTAFLSVISKSAVIMVMIPFLYQTFEEKIDVWYPALIMLALASVLVANLFAIQQLNIKRLLAFSSIAQVGFLLIGLSAHTQTGATSVLFFLIIYLFSNLAAFGVVSVLSSEYGKEEIQQLSGLYSTHPFLSWVLALSLFSLAGIPPTAGFFGKFFLLLSGANKGNYWVIAIAAINMVISLYYYLRVVKTIFMNQPVSPMENKPLAFPVKLALVICLLGILVVGFLGGFYEHIFQLLNGIN